MTGPAPHYDVDSILDATLTPSAGPARVISGEPTAASRTLHRADGVEIGIWEVTPGEFHSTKTGLTEFMHFVSGAGVIEHADGTVTRIAPGAVLHVLDGWSGIWRVTETARKCYTVDRRPGMAG
ncbi:cupin domain-containing protein [Nakamurella leprariae]|uniref:DUF861 domain-containing protein n=1 Tax=Nakamurella leprariae TaxID=2803911 RepID=A0A939BXH6_9ACTN|nr:cupin domain-containing protein [Nakamurella leprariae]MBM9468563.1 DUF861 domain-containing protein [Nakamurella leprariae]